MIKQIPGFWAKLEQDGDGTIHNWYPLLHHSADVAATMEALLKRTILRKRFARIAGWTDLSEVFIARLSVLAALHDAGKVNHGFQNRASPHLQPRGGHVAPMVETLEAENPMEILEPLGVLQMVSWFPSKLNLKYYLLTTWSHHGYPVLPKSNFNRNLWNPSQQRNPIEELQRLGTAVQDWFPRAFEDDEHPFPEEPAFQHSFNGLLTLADWLGSDRRFFSFQMNDGSVIEQSRRRASKAINSVGLDTSQFLHHLGDKPVKFKAISQWEPYDVQQKCMELETFAEGSLTILESDTGSGKTEAALIRFMRLYQKGLVDGLYFAVPTRSAATQLYSRVHDAMKRVFSQHHNHPPVVQAVPGYIKVDETEGNPLPHFKVQWPDNQKDYLRYRGWAAEHTKRYLAGAVVIGTIDQVLLSTLQVNHAHLRATALLRHFLVVDEVHASDVYMTGLLERVLDQHLSAGGHALLMSATLGSTARTRLLSGKGAKTEPLTEALETPYPLISHVDATRREPVIQEAESSGHSKSVQTDVIAAAENSESIAETAAHHAQSGARVLVIRNTVKDCIATQRALEDHVEMHSGLLFGVNGIPAPHHSRFAPDDRKRLDREIEEVFQRGSSRGSVVAIATQTVEQSLDIDADLLITDLCPMDVLLQRIGRLHRHKRTRPQRYKQAQCLVLVPEDRDLAKAIIGDGRATRGKHGLGTVYQDLRMLEATWRLLSDPPENGWQIPQDNRMLVERATHPEVLIGIVEDLGDKWHLHEEYILGKVFADQSIASFVCINHQKPFGDEGFAQDLDRVKTRLGLDNYHVDLPNPVRGPFGNNIEGITLTEWQISGIPETTEAETVTEIEGGFQFSYSNRRFQYDRFGVTQLSD